MHKIDISATVCIYNSSLSAHLLSEVALCVEGYDVHLVGHAGPGPGGGDGGGRGGRGPAGGGHRVGQLLAMAGRRGAELGPAVEERGHQHCHHCYY